MTLPEELLLLALHDEQGAIVPAAERALPTGLAGAALMELALRGRIRYVVVDDDDAVVVADPSPTGDDLLDDALARVGKAVRPREPGLWVEALARDLSDAKDRLVARMVARGVLRREERRVFWIVPSRRFPLEDARAEQDARERVRAVVLDGAAPDERTAALVALVEACRLESVVFAPDERVAARRRIAALTDVDDVHPGMFGGGALAALLAAIAGATAHRAFLLAGGAAGSASDEDAGSGSATDAGASADTPAGAGGPGSGGGDSGGGAGGD